ncbi:hypothetical protein HDV00_008479 [Rhizophlyctis rosea]|nr:hypothetical protein HDV00_008479 [Rhizophlyctis rosea]
MSDAIVDILKTRFWQLKYQGVITTADIAQAIAEDIPEATNTLHLEHYMEKVASAVKSELEGAGFELISWKGESDRLGKLRFAYAAASRKPATMRRLLWERVLIPVAVILPALALAALVVSADRRLQTSPM